MNIKKHIPNFLTCCNLICGCIGIAEAFKGNLVAASYLTFLACLFDFFDGFVARILRVTSSIGKELDSLADMVTFGLLPGIIVYQLLFTGVSYENSKWVALTAFLIPVFSALRLAKFNIDTRQSDSFIGVPTPANAILITSFPLIIESNKMGLASTVSNAYFLVGITLIMSCLLVAELPLFALKFKSFKWVGNQIRYGFLISTVVLFLILNWAAIPVIIISYIILSFIENKLVQPQKI